MKKILLQPPPFIKARLVPADIWAYSLLFIIFLFRLIFIGKIGLVPDEAYYWSWSRSLAFGYFDHPPMVAWLIALSSKLFGDTERGVKFMAIAASFLASLCAYRLAKKYVLRTSSLLIYVLLTNAVVLFSVGSLVATPDIPLALFWSMGLLAAYTWIFEYARGAWLILGIIMGLGLLSKYIFILFIVSLVGFLLWSEGKRRLLLSWRLYASLLTAFLVFLPNLIWNSHHGWITMLFQMKHGLGASGFPRFDYLGEYLAGQLGILSIFPAIIMVMAIITGLRRYLKSPSHVYLLFFLAVPFFFFAFSSMQKRVEANWPSPAYISGLLLVPIYWEFSRKKIVRFFILFSLAVSLLASAAILEHVRKPFLPLAVQMDPTTQIRGWRQWAREAYATQAAIDPGFMLPVCAARYQETALLAFYMPSHPQAATITDDGRKSQYSLSEKEALLSLKNFIFICAGRDSAPSLSDLKGISQFSRLGAAELVRSAGNREPYGIFLVKAAQ